MPNEPADPGSFYRYDGRKQRHVGTYDPRDYGAKFDGLTDDLPALEACASALPAVGGVIVLPEGKAWTSDVWRIPHTTEIRGCGGGGSTLHCAIEVAPGKQNEPADPGSFYRYDGRKQRHVLLYRNAEGYVGPYSPDDPTQRLIPRAERRAMWKKRNIT